MAAPTKDNSYILGLVCDFETGGLKCQNAAITQIAIHAYRLDTFEHIGTYVAYAQPYNQREVKGVTSARKTLKSKYDKPEEKPMEYTEGAMKVTGITMEMLEEQGIDIDKMAQEVLQFIKDHTVPKTPKIKMPIFIGQNFGFDEGFICQLFEYTGLVKELKKLVRGREDFYGNWHPDFIDTLFLGQLVFANNPQIPNYKLSTLAEYLGVELHDAHEADADVLATANILAVLTKRMRRANGGDDDAEGEDEIQLAKAKKSRLHFKI